ncbi:MAG: helix-hairpin-helix domain-containing protein [Bacteroidales bacterium]
MSVKMKLSKREASGALSLVILILVIQTAIFIFQPEAEKEVAVNELVGKESIVKKSIIKDSIVEDFAVKEFATNQLDSTTQIEIQKNGVASTVREPSSFYSKVSLAFQFDPNTITLEELVKLGLTPKQASVVINYRSKGGVFKKREDFKKIYVLPKGFYERVKDSIYIKLPEKSRNNKNNYNLEQKKLLVELNKVDSIELVKLPGIGPYYAKRIIEFREKCGGLITTKELMEIKGIDSARFSLFANMVFVDTLNIVKKDLNRATLHELSEHPHIGPYLARSIVRFREISGNEGVTLALLVLNKIVAPELFKKLKYFFN